ncbi:hypothetical protein IGI04_018206 [Brassica rapa subsp. trilocularis]|uniref:Uncharacterized protein n=1 Tax=Brassica rapa subsp. trilocularis TaxID=1813537 RepID=A0ABQ7MC95_BRACM|nr:hypothetical protein IGI04_018206 [Brassica rapa subsp. trilocularis]
MFFSFILISPIPLQAYRFSHLSYLSPRLSHLSHLSPTASPPRLTTTRVALSPPPPRSPSHHHHGRTPTTTTVALPPPPRWGGKVHGGWRRQGPWRLEDGSLVAAGGGKAHGCWKRGKVMEEAAAVFSFLFF